MGWCLCFAFGSVVAVAYLEVGMVMAVADFG